jgi:hypothetical protein
MERLECGHEGEFGGRVCEHLLMQKDQFFYEWINSETHTHYLFCYQCWMNSSTEKSNLKFACASCFREIDELSRLRGLISREQPEFLQRRTTLHFEHRFVDLSCDDTIIDLQPIPSSPSGEWLALTDSHQIIRINPSEATASFVTTLPPTDFDLSGDLCLDVNRGGNLAAIVHAFGQRGIVLDLQAGTTLMQLNRGAEHPTVSGFPVAFFEFEGRTLLIHESISNQIPAEGWSQPSGLFISDPGTGQNLTDRFITTDSDEEHGLDYYHGRLILSPNEERVAEHGWVWQPAGLIATWNIHSWMNYKWEPEDGASRKEFHLTGRWDRPICWIDNTTLAVSGNTEDSSIPAASIYDVMSGQFRRSFSGPQVDQGSTYQQPDYGFEFDTYLFSTSETHGTSVWDVETGERLAHDPFWFKRYHRGTKEFLRVLPDGRLQVSRLVGNGG